MPKKKASEAPANQEPVQLRRSSRTTRGSVKPVVDLSKDQVSDNEDEFEGTKKSEKIKNDDPVESEVDDDEDFVEPAKTKKSSRAKPNSGKKKQQQGDKLPATEDHQDEKLRDSKALTKTQRSSVSKSGKAGGKVKAGAIKDAEEDVSVEVNYELSEKEMKEINHAFDINCSAGGEEQLETDGLKTAIRSLGFEPRSNEIQILSKKFSNKKGKISRDSFHKIMAFKMASAPGTNDHDMCDEISRVFNLIDIDRTGLITFDNLKSIALELNETITDEELHEMILEADFDGDLKINQQEFYNIMKKTSLY